MAPVLLEIQPMNLTELDHDELEHFQDLLNKNFKAECKIKGFKKDPATGIEVKVACEHPPKDTMTWAGGIGKDWYPVVHEGISNEQFGVAYISVKDMERANKVMKELKEVPCFCDSMIHIKVVHELPDLVPHRGNK